MPRKTQKPTNSEDTNSEKTEDNKEKANILSDYFASVFTNEPLGELPQMTPIEIQNELKDLVINKDMVLKLLQNLKIDKLPGPDSLHPRLLFEIKESIAETLRIIFNQSLTLKTVPKEWKNTQISAIFKKGNTSQNYRPVSLTSVVCKIMKKLIRTHIIQHMKANNLFSNKQYSFIAVRSTAL